MSIFSIRRASDIRSLVFIAITFALLIITLKTNLTFGDYLLFISILPFWVIVCSLINHNHRHHPIFKKNIYNNILNIFLSIAIGAPSTRLHLVHHFNHHFHYPSHEDWSHFELNAKGVGCRRIINYLINATKSMTKNREQLVKTNYQRKSLRIERIFIYIFSAASLYLNSKAFLLIIVPSWIIGLSLLLTSNLLNHDMCNLDSDLNHSRDFLNKLENWFFCNNGYHTAHHLSPHLHWEDLPTLHREKVEPIKQSQYVSGSFFYFLFQYCLKRS